MNTRNGYSVTLNRSVTKMRTMLTPVFMKMLVLPLSRLLTSQAGGKSILGPLRKKKEYAAIPPPDYEQINEAASSGSQVSRSYMPFFLFRAYASRRSNSHRRAYKPSPETNKFSRREEEGAKLLINAFPLSFLAFVHQSHSYHLNSSLA